MLLSDYITQVRVLIHDLASQDWTDGELTTIVNNARMRVALDAHCVRRFYVGNQLIPNQEIYPITGGVGRIQLLTGGTGYPAVPTVTIAAPPAGGVQATATAVAVGGVVQSITITNWGSRYVSNPAVTIGGGGAGATASATAMFNVLDVLSISIVWPGNAQRYMMAWMPFSPFQAFCRANATSFSNPSVWSTHDETNQLFYYAPPNQAYTAEIDAVVLPDALVNLADNDTQVLQPNADAVQYYSAHIALAKLQNVEISEYWRKIYTIRMREIKQTRQDRRIPNIYRNYFRRINRY